MPKNVESYRKLQLQKYKTADLYKLQDCKQGDKINIKTLEWKATLKRKKQNMEIT